MGDERAEAWPMQHSSPLVPDRPGMTTNRSIDRSIGRSVGPSTVQWLNRPRRNGDDDGVCGLNRPHDLRLCSSPPPPIRPIPTHTAHNERSLTMFGVWVTRRGSSDVPCFALWCVREGEQGQRAKKALHCMIDGRPLGAIHIHQLMSVSR